MSNSPLVTYTRLSPNCTKPRNHKIDTITIHCTAGQGTAKQILDLPRFVIYSAKNGASCNYAVGKDGSIGLGVSEENRSWCSSNRANDQRAITIEVSSENKSPYAVTDAAYFALLELLEDICRRNNIKKLVWSDNKSDRTGHKNGCNMTVHRDFSAKSCPGDYLYSLHGSIAAEVNRRLGIAETPSTLPFKPYIVRVDVKNMSIRKGPGTNYAATQIIPQGFYTIEQEKNGWGKLKSGAGWIPLEFAVKMP